MHARLGSPRRGFNTRIILRNPYSHPEGSVFHPEDTIASGERVLWPRYFGCLCCWSDSTYCDGVNKAIGYVAAIVLQVWVCARPRSAVHPIDELQRRASFNVSSI